MNNDLMQLVDEQTKEDPPKVDTVVLQRRLLKSRPGVYLVPFEHVDMNHAHIIASADGTHGVIGQRYGMVYMEKTGNHIWIDCPADPESPMWHNLLNAVLSFEEDVPSEPAG